VVCLTDSDPVVSMPHNIARAPAARTVCPSRPAGLAALVMREHHLALLRLPRRERGHDARHDDADARHPGRTVRARVRGGPRVGAGRQAAHGRNLGPLRRPGGADSVYPGSRRAYRGAHHGRRVVTPRRRVVTPSDRRAKRNCRWCVLVGGKTRTDRVRGSRLRAVNRREEGCPTHASGHSGLTLLRSPMGSWRESRPHPSQAPTAAPGLKRASWCADTPPVDRVIGPSGSAVVRRGPVSGCARGGGACRRDSDWVG
jgi:hypothetical protein